MTYPRFLVFCMLLLLLSIEERVLASDCNTTLSHDDKGGVSIAWFIVAIVQFVVIGILVFLCVLSIVYRFIVGSQRMMMGEGGEEGEGEEEEEEEELEAMDGEQANMEQRRRGFRRGFGRGFRRRRAFLPYWLSAPYYLWGLQRPFWVSPYAFRGWLGRRGGRRFGRRGGRRMRGAGGRRMGRGRR